MLFYHYTNLNLCFDIYLKNVSQISKNIFLLLDWIHIVKIVLLLLLLLLLLWD